MRCKYNDEYESSLFNPDKYYRWKTCVLKDKLTKMWGLIALESIPKGFYLFNYVG